jgi:LmbE family N-acetylglucosaminyl deacetylase
MGEGAGPRFVDDQRPPEDVERLAAEFTQAAAILGVSPHQLGFPDQRFERADLLDVVKSVEHVKDEVGPDLVMTHHPGDLNTDHRIVANAVLTAFRPTPSDRPVTLAAFETLSSTEWNVPSNGASFVPNIFVEISAGLDRKLSAMSCYTSEIRDWPHPRSLRGIEVAAQRWGMTVGLANVEAFQLLRSVIDPA